MSQESKCFIRVGGYDLADAYGQNPVGYFLTKGTEIWAFRVALL